MNQGRIWCVVHPTVGLPLLLGSVALTSLAVHTAVMTHTTWMSNYWQGAARARTAENTGPAAPKADAAYTVSIAPVAAVAGQRDAAFVVTVSPAAPRARCRWRSWNRPTAPVSYPDAGIAGSRRRP